MVSPVRHEALQAKQNMNALGTNVMQEESIINTNITPIKPQNDSSLNNVTAEYDMQLEDQGEDEYDPNASFGLDVQEGMQDDQMGTGENDEIFDIQQTEIVFN